MKRFGVISCTDDKKWGFSEAMVSRYSEFFSLNSNDEEWVGFHALRGDVPRPEDLDKFDAFLITGSISSVNDNKKWIAKLLEFIRSAAETSEKKRPKIIGICFGHQLIAKALGGEVGANPDKKFVLQTEVIESTNIEVAKAESIRGLFDKGSLRALQSHGECVLKLPAGAVSLASSATCEHEMIQFTENILGLQCHTEVFTDEAEELILPYIAKAFGWDNEDVNKSSDSLKMECDYKDINRAIVEYINVV